MRELKMTTFIIGVFLILFIAFGLINYQTEYSHKELNSYEFNITFIDQYGGFYGDSSDGKGLYFTSDDLEEKSEILIGDKVLAWFPVGNIENVIKVKKIK